MAKQYYHPGHDACTRVIITDAMWDRRHFSTKACQDITRNRKYYVNRFRAETGIDFKEQESRTWYLIYYAEWIKIIKPAVLEEYGETYNKRIKGE